jgi:hypothetical protein
MDSGILMIQDSILVCSPDLRIPHTAKEYPHHFRTLCHYTTRGGRKLSNGGKTFPLVEDYWPVENNGDSPSLFVISKQATIFDPHCSSDYFEFEIQAKGSGAHKLIAECFYQRKYVLKYSTRRH